MEQEEVEKRKELLYEAVAEWLGKGNYDYTVDWYCGEGDKEAVEFLEACESEIRRIAEEVEEEIMKRVEKVVCKR